MTDISLGPFQVAVNCTKEVVWEDPTDNLDILNLRLQFEQNLDLICADFQKVMALGVRNAIKKKGMFFELPDLNMEGMNNEQLAELINPEG